MNKRKILNDLPGYAGESVLINEDQTVNDIIDEVLKAHKFFARDYDNIYQYFLIGNNEEICRGLFDFCKDNIIYDIESEDLQSTRSPSALLEIGRGDCKHYAGFIGGILGAINRNTNKKINWCYRFAGYSYLSDAVAHVFIVVKDGNREIWVDPVLKEFDQRSPKPVIFIDEKIKEKMLTRISGLGLIDLETDLSDFSDLHPVDYSDISTPDAAAVQVVRLPADIPQDTAADELPTDLKNAIQQLLYYGIIDENLNFDNDKYSFVMQGLNDADLQSLNDAVFLIVSKMDEPIQIGNIFSDIWNGIKTVVATPVRAAFLGLVSLNVFNLGTKLYNAMFNADGSIYQKGFDKVHSAWYKWGGKITNLENAAKTGHKKKAILGAASEVTATAPAAGVTAASCAIPGVGTWICTASAIIVAMIPLLTSILKAKSQDMGIDSLSQQAALNAYNASAGAAANAGNTFNKILPYVLIAGAGLFLYFDMKKSKK